MSPNRICSLLITLGWICINFLLICLESRFIHYLYQYANVIVLFAFNRFIYLYLFRYFAILLKRLTADCYLPHTITRLRENLLLIRTFHCNTWHVLLGRNLNALQKVTKSWYFSIALPQGHAQRVMDCK